MSDKLRTAMAIDKSGTGAIFNLFYSELEKRAYYITGDLDEVFISLDLTEEEVKKSKPLSKGLKKAITAIMDDYGI